MYGPHPKMMPGVSTPNIPAMPWNDLMDMLEWYKREVSQSEIVKQQPKLFDRRNGILVKNATEQSLDTGNIVAINGSVYDPAKTQQVDYFKHAPIFARHAAGVP